MKNKAKYIIIILLIIAVFGFGFYFITHNDKNTNLNLLEKQWIEKNKNNIIDIGIIDNIPVLSYSGEGIVIDFLNSLHKETKLSFNKVSYKLKQETPSDYSFVVADKVEDNQILIYEDNYALITKSKKFNSLDDLKGLNIGVLNEDLANVNNYLHNADVTYKTFENKDLLINEFNGDTSLDAIVLLKTIDLDKIMENNYKIAFGINDYKKYVVLKLGSENDLNNILKKYYKKWSKNNYDELYQKYLSKDYLDFRNVNDSETVKFRSKRYIYGFIPNAPYDLILDNKLTGINYQVLSNFSKLTNVEISYKEFDNINDMVNAFNSNQIDLFYGINSNEQYKLDVYKTAPIYNNSYVILKHSSNDKLITSIKSLDKVVGLENSNVTKYFNDNNVTVSAYNNMENLIKGINNDDIIALDLYTYNYYLSKLKNYVIAYQFETEDNSFIVRNISDNKIFEEFLDFYVSFNDSQKFVTSGLNELLIVNKGPHILKNIALVLGTLVGLLLIALGIMKIKPNKKKKDNLTKEDKLRYIDTLTSLKNRNYLNNSMEKWDNNEIYPQTIVIVDLNKVTYINDNYGHTEGDELIKQAANLLIVNQLPNSEIVRTNGNEFLIYLVGYEEKDVVSYMKKLKKELKELKHGFGAAIGYSMITDEIKTIDDAINEATIDMRNNKEESRE